MSFNWADHRFTGPVLCTFACRPEYNGRPARSDHLALNGQTIELTPLWQMDADDPYPGEWALSTPDGCRDLFRLAGVTWIASGDVAPNANQ